jgi:hypothetical protein
LNKYVTEVQVGNEIFVIHLSSMYSRTVGEHVFDFEIRKDEAVVHSNNITIYTKKDAEIWIRHFLKCKGMRFSWRDLKIEASKV